VNKCLHLEEFDRRSLRTLIFLRKVKLPNEPSPISEHSFRVGQPILAASRLSAGYRLSQAASANLPRPARPDAKAHERRPDGI